MLVLLCMRSSSLMVSCMRHHRRRCSRQVAYPDKTFYYCLSVPKQLSKMPVSSGLLDQSGPCVQGRIRY